jgi:hypothetical protein
MKQDDLKRGKRAVVCSIVMQADGKVRLVMDDAASSTDEFPQSWRSDVLFTFNDYQAQEFLNSELSEKQLADIGLNIVLRLAALMNARSGTT